MRFLLLVLFTLAPLACNKNYSPDQTRPYVVYGDDLAFGTGVSHQRFNLASCLGRKVGAYFENMGRPKETSRAALGRLPQLLEVQPKLVVLSVGQSDLRLPKSSAFTADETYENLAQIFAKLNSAGVPVYYIDRDGPEKAFDDRLSHVAEIAQRYANVHFVKDTTGEPWRSPQKMFDDEHPNNEGYAELCERIFQTIKQSSQR